MKRSIGDGLATVLIAAVFVLLVQAGFESTSFAASTAPATDRYTYFENLDPFDPLTSLESDEIRTTFMGSMIPLPVRLAQAEMSVFVEVGWVDDPSDTYYHGRPVDQFVFDMGAGVSANFSAAKVGYRRMDKVFINHLHGDHMNDLVHTYCFGPSSDRKSPLYVWGSKPSGVQNPSHTSQGAFGYLLSQIEPRPRLTVATHFPVADDTVESALTSVQSHCPDVQMGDDIVWSFDLMVLRVFPDRVEQRRADVSRFSFTPPVRVPDGLLTPKYHDGTGAGDPYAQIDITAQIPPTNPDGTEN